MRRTPPARPALVRLESRDAPAATLYDYTFGTDGQAPVPGPTGAVTDLAFAPDGRIVVVGPSTLPGGGARPISSSPG